MSDTNVIHIVDLGLQATLDAKASGVLISVVAFKIGDSDLPTEDDSVDLFGNVLAQGNIAYVEVLNNNTARFTFRVSPDTNGVGFVGKEVAFYFDTGVMFGRCVFTKPIEFLPGEQYQLSGLVSNSRCDMTVINVTIGEYSSVPGTPNLSSLGIPDESDFNVVLVHDLNENPDGSISAGVASKFGGGSMQWAYSGYERVLSFSPTTANNDQFSAATLPNYNWGSGEVIIAYVLNGAARGQSRKFYWETASASFRAKTDGFVGLTPGQTVAIWRAINRGGIVSQLPSRENIPPTWVLACGQGAQPVWTPPGGGGRNMSTLYVAPGRMRITTINGMGSGDKRRYSMNGVQVRDNNHVITAVGGVTQHRAAFTINSAEIEYSENIPVNAPVDIRAFTKEPGTGTYMDMVCDTFVGDGARVRFALSQPIEDVNYSLVYARHIMQQVTNYTYDEDTQEIVFTTPIPAGIELDACLFLPRSDEGYSTKVVTANFITAGSVLFVQLPVQPHSKAHIFLTVSGMYIHKNAYTINGDKLLFGQAIDANIPIEVLIIQNEKSSGSPQSDLGPVITDVLLASDSMHFLRNGAPPLKVPLPIPTLKAGAGMRIEGVYPEIEIINLNAESHVPTTYFKISKRKVTQEQSECIITERVHITGPMRLHVVADMFAKLGPGFEPTGASQRMEYVIGFVTGNAKAPEYGRDIRGTGYAGFSSPNYEENQATVYSNASLTQVYDVKPENYPSRYLEIVIKVRLTGVDASQYAVLLGADYNIVATPLLI